MQYVPEALGSLPRGSHALHVPATAVPYVQRTVAPPQAPHGRPANPNPSPNPSPMPNPKTLPLTLPRTSSASPCHPRLLWYPYPYPYRRLQGQREPFGHAAVRQTNCTHPYP